MKSRAMRRNFFMIALLFAVLCSFSPARAAENTIGVIMSGDIPYYQELHKAFMGKLAQDGLASKTEVILQKPYPDRISLSNAARKLIAMDVDVIVVYGAPAALAVVSERTRIPLVYAAIYEPIVAELRTRNITGIYAKLSISSVLRYLRSLKQVSTLGVVYSSNEEDSAMQFGELVKLGAQYGIRIDGINLKRHQDAAARLAGHKMDAILLTGSIAQLAETQIVSYAKEQGIPYAAFFLCADARMIVSLSAHPHEQGEKAAERVRKILDGVSPERIKAEAGHDVELTFNLREATAMGLKLSMELVTEATKLIK